MCIPCTIYVYHITPFTKIYEDLLKYLNIKLSKNIIFHQTFIKNNFKFVRKFIIEKKWIALIYVLEFYIIFKIHIYTASLTIWMNMSINCNSRYQCSFAIKKKQRYAPSLWRLVKLLSRLNNYRLSQQHWTSNKAKGGMRENKRGKKKEGTRLQDATDWRFATWCVTVNVRDSIRIEECMRLHSSEYAWQTRLEVRKYLNRLLYRLLIVH